LRWAADAVVIFRTKGSDFDWDYLLRQARQRHVLAPVRESITYLAQNLEIAVPGVIQAAIEREPISRVEILDYKLRGKDPTRISSLAGAFLQFQNYRRRSRELTDGRTLPAICSWLRKSGLWPTVGSHLR
jgi:hypothetical protein